MGLQSENKVVNPCALHYPPPSRMPALFMNVPFCPKSIREDNMSSSLFGVRKDQRCNFTLNNNNNSNNSLNNNFNNILTALLPFKRVKSP